ncbi:hypothetical protein BHU72_07485 [Desulfuribacillus stibiiarsenatis]|uniref:DUF2325 domain-containing protein n=1 Tax=Desulfuribacillus stibiiarsenatis TaxID=1390249 RepID=A0A1E5L4X5_9FIRM|nr:hypothetical protein [Desulfuribacillus stibiiarsenatis]OEH85019.1 hypothetical protein BHU72_07485 [Desulfuribacillus stibiiarsenatis]
MDNTFAKDILEFYGVTPVAYVDCPECGGVHEISLEKTPEKLPISSLPWVLFFKDLYILPGLVCCGKNMYPTHIRIKHTAVISKELEDELFADHQSYHIGTLKVPVITNEPLGYPITRSYLEQIDIQKQLDQQNRLLARKQQEFYETCYTYFSIHFEEIIQEIDGTEIVDVFHTIAETPFGIHIKETKYPKNKKDKKARLNWVKKQIRSIIEHEGEEGTRVVYYLIVKYFVEWELIQGIYYLHWNVPKYQKMIGKKLLLYMILQFPLTSYFSYLREEALSKLIQSKGSHRKKSEVVDIVQKNLDKANETIEKMKHTILRQKESIILFENKVKELESKNDAITKQLQAREEQGTDAAQTRKIKELKGIIDELRADLVPLRELKEDVVRKMEEDSEKELLDTLDEKVRELDILGSTIESNEEILRGKTIGVFGDIQFSQDDLDTGEAPFRILNSISVQDIEGLSLMKKSDVLVVLTQHISHNCMWTIKAHASSRSVPVLFTRHTNLKIIVNQAAKIVKLQQSRENISK